jgi:hypothetical protein
MWPEFILTVVTIMDLLWFRSGCAYITGGILTVDVIARAYDSIHNN